MSKQTEIQWGEEIIAQLGGSNEWTDCTLGEVINLKRGYDLPKHSRKSGTIPIISSSGITDYHSEPMAKAPGVITGRYGTIGQVFFSDVDYWPLNTALYVQDFKGNDQRFIYYLLTAFDFEQFSDKSAVPGINRNHIHEAAVSIPPLPEQRAIAAVLSSLDDKIDLLHRQNATLEALAETLFRQWFVEEAKEEWVKGKLPDEFTCVMGSSPPGESYNNAGVGLPMFQGNADFGYRFPSNRVYTTDAKRLATKFDTLVSVRAPVGAQNMANETCCIGRGVAAFRYKKDPTFYSYTYFKMRSLMIEFKEFNQTGTVFGSISKADVDALSVTIPPLEIVKRFQSEVKPIDDKVISNTNQIQTLSTLRDTLLPKLMSGEVRVAY
ncbi:restriction endonuclease subunit S [Hymenobacter rubripertinctus]|uniref:Restriction endonuclease subunit S n=2 Tax=Hymenobacter rubripertinctus TaxID=2029981 RepID=A0A418R4R5_9BACT|nr:restriction endonuclease subunit S [Hymenobacter rubripertinctus]RIY12402.1 restriction endonuclease subunit S [Hymenobacter rubripertinctus]